MAHRRVCFMSGFVVVMVIMVTLTGSRWLMLMCDSAGCMMAHRRVCFMSGFVVVMVIMVTLTGGRWLMLMCDSAGCMMAHRRTCLMSRFWMSNCDSLRFAAATGSTGLMASRGCWCVRGSWLENRDSFFTFAAGWSGHFLEAAASSGKMACHGP